MNAAKICFIACVNDENLYKINLDFVRKISVPEGITVETLAMRGQESMTKGYNNAMCSTDAKYKVYMHQDTLIANQNFIFDVLRIFKSNNKIGMIGVAGCKDIPPNGVWWDAEKEGYSKKYGRLFECECSFNPDTLKLWSFGEINDDYVFVGCIDGLIMITQYDVPWREDLFNGWHFYDESQCLEFSRKGYKIVVPKQDDIWIIHACRGDIMDMGAHDYYRKIFLGEYKDDLAKQKEQLKGDL